MTPRSYDSHSTGELFTTGANNTAVGATKCNSTLGCDNGGSDGLEDKRGISIRDDDDGLRI